MILKEIDHKDFANGSVYLLHTQDGLPVEVTDTFLPYYTKHAISEHQNYLKDYCLGNRTERWMIGVSTMSGCPIGCKFCSAGKLKHFRNLKWEEIVKQIIFIFNKQQYATIYRSIAKELKINYTRLGEPFLNLDNVKKAINHIDERFNNIRVLKNKEPIHHFVSTIGIKGSDFSWIRENITLQFSVHSFKEEYRNWLIPYKHKMTLEEMGKVRTNSKLKTTINLTLVNSDDFDIDELKKYFDPEYFFIKISPINKNSVSEENNMGDGIISQNNLI